MTSAIPSSFDIVDERPPSLTLDDALAYRPPIRGECNGRHYMLSLKLSGSAALTIITITELTPLIFMDPGVRVDALLTAGAGALLQGAFLLTAPRKISDPQKSFLIDYCADIFLITTQIYLNLVYIPGLNPSPRWLDRVTFGSVNALTATAVTSLLHNIIHWGRSRDITNFNYSPLPLTDKHTIKLLWGNSSPSRVVMDTLKVIAGTSGIVSGFIWKEATIPSLFGTILVAYGLAGTVQEALRLLRQRIEKKRQEPGLPLNEIEPPELTLKTKTIRLAQKSLLLASSILSGPGLAYPLAPLYATAGALFGLGQRAQLHYFTGSDPRQIPEIQRVEDVRSRTYLEAILKDGWKWTVSIGVAAFLVSQVIVSDTVGRAAIIAFAIALYPSYIISRLVDRYDIVGAPNRFLNTLYYLLHFAIEPPYGFVVTSEAMRIGDKAMEKYEGYEILLVCLAYAWLGYSLGSWAGHRATNRQRNYPADFNPLLILLTYFFTDQLFNNHESSGTQTQNLTFSSRHPMAPYTFRY